MGKEILVIYNIYGYVDSIERYDTKLIHYKQDIESIIHDIDESKLNDKVRVVVSSVKSNQTIIDELISTFKNNISIFYYEDGTLPVQVTFNKTCLACEQEFNETYKAYAYISSGVTLRYDHLLFPMIYSKLDTPNFGILTIRVNIDAGLSGLGYEYSQGIKPINFDFEYNISPGHFVHTHLIVISKALRDFYGVPLTDVHGFSRMENVVSYTCAALRKSYTLLPYIANHLDRFDSYRTSEIITEVSKELLLWNRDINELLDDKEAIESGIGYCTGDFDIVELSKEKLLDYDHSKYDENHFALDDRLKYFVKKYFFTNKNELDYSNIKYKHLNK